MWYLFKDSVVLFFRSSLIVWLCLFIPNESMYLISLQVFTFIAFFLTELGIWPPSISKSNVFLTVRAALRIGYLGGLTCVWAWAVFWIGMMGAYVGLVETVVFDSIHIRIPPENMFLLFIFILHGMIVLMGFIFSVVDIFDGASWRENFPSRWVLYSTYYLYGAMAWGIPAIDYVPNDLP